PVCVGGSRLTYPKPVGTSKTAILEDHPGTLAVMASQLDPFLATMVAPSRPTPTERVLELAHQYYGLEPKATRLTGERDENFRLSVADGAEYVFKIANPAENPAETDLQTAALLHIEKTDPTAPCPRVLRDRSGATHIRFTDESGAERTARLLTYLP